jgi:hypothetical protein
MTLDNAHYILKTALQSNLGPIRANIQCTSFPSWKLRLDVCEIWM